LLNTVLKKSRPAADPPPILADYAAACASFSWDAVAASLGVPLEGPLNLGELAVRRGGSLVWLGTEGQGERYGPADLEAGSARFGRALADLGVGPGDRVAFVTRPIPELVIGVLGALRAGAVPVVLARPRSPEALRAPLASSGARLVVLEPEHKPVLDAFRNALPDLKSVLLLSRGGTQIRGAGPGDVLWTECVERAPSELAPHLGEAGRPAWLHYVDPAGSASVLTHRAAFGLAHSAGAALDLRAGDGIVTVAVPGDTLFMPYLLLAPLLAGATAVLFEDPARFIRYSQLADKVRVWLSATRAIDLLLRNDPGLGQLLSACRHIAVTHPYDPELVAMTQLSYGSPLHPVWLPRELAVIQTAEFRAHDLRLGSVGRPLPGTELRNDPDSGRLAAKLGPAAPWSGFWQDSVATGRRVQNGWFLLDPPAKMNGDAYAWITA
jgi:acetyl-CoA synthetase